MNQAPRKAPTAAWSCQKILKDYTVWFKDEICALSSVVFIEDEHLPPHWEWLISFSQRSRLPLNNKQIQQCLVDFDALNFEEDNHEEGVVRKFWLAVEDKYRKPCPCKDEEIVTLGDYRYSKKETKL